MSVSFYNFPQWNVHNRTVDVKIKTRLDIDTLCAEFLKSPFILSHNPSFSAGMISKR